MSENAYQSGISNLTFVGHCTYAKCPACPDWNAIGADVAVLGVPNDMGTQWRLGACFGVRTIREAPTPFPFGHGGAYDFEDPVMDLTRDQIRMVDVGDADIVHVNAHLDFVDERQDVLDFSPEAHSCYITIDIDGFDPPIAPGGLWA